MNRLKSLIVAACAVFGAIVFALPSIPAAADSASLSIVPRKDYVINPGQTVKDTLSISNLDQTSELDLTFRVIDFTYTGNGGTPKLELADNFPQTTWSLKSFLTLPESVTIPAGATKTVNMSVAIPADQGAGSYYSAILYTSSAPNGGNVGLSASGVTLVFVTVPGKVSEALTLQKFGAYKAPADNGGELTGYYHFTTLMPEDVAYTLQNSGNVAESPAGSITMKYMFGKTTTITNVNPVGSLALIGQSRTFDACIKLQPQTVNIDGTTSSATTCTSPGLWPGLYHLNLDVFYGQNGNLTQEIIGASWFWYLPWWFDITFLVVLVIVVAFVWRTYNRIRNWMNGSKMKRSLRRRK